MNKHRTTRSPSPNNNKIEMTDMNSSHRTSIEREHKAIPGGICKKGQPSVAVKIEGPNQPMYGRQLEDKDTLYALISRESIDTLKEFYKDEVTRDEWKLIIDLKKVIGVS